MELSALNVSGAQVLKATENVDTGRKDVEKAEVNIEKVASSESTSVQPEEILTQIKGLTENGAYSVRFESNPVTKELVVKIVDAKTNEVIRTVPTEDVLGMKANIANLPGSIMEISS
jgi:flagellar protein FlaG